MLKRKLVLVRLISFLAFMLGIGGGGIVADVFGVDIVPAVYAAEGCEGGGGC